MAKIRSKIGLGTAALVVSGVVCKALGAVYRLPLTNLLGLQGIGIFQLVMALFSFALVITSGGVTSSLSKLISSARARGENEKIMTYFWRAFFSSAAIGLLLGAVFACFGRWICALQGVEATKTYILFLLLLPLGGMLAALRGFFQGHENMLPTATSQVVEQVLKFVFGLVFASYFVKFGVSEGVFGAFLGIVLSELGSVVLLAVIFLFRDKEKQKNRDMSAVKFARREFDKANFSLMLTSSILPLVSALDTLFIIQRLETAGLSTSASTTLFGLQSGVVGAILNFPLIISMALSSTLLPKISYAVSRGSGGRVIVERALKTLIFLIFPTTFGLVAISKPLLRLFYSGISTPLLNVGFELMLYGGFAIILTALMQFFIMLLQAHGQFRFLLFCMVLGGSAKLALSFFLSALPSVNIFALVLGNISLAGVVSVLSLWKLKKISAFSVKFSDIFSLTFGTLAMFWAVYTFLEGDRYSAVINLILAVLIGVFVYVVLTIPFALKLRPERNELDFKKSLKD